MLTSFPQTASSVRISRLPTRMLSQISRGEFVNFGILLTASTSGIADPPFTVTVQQISESSQAVCLAQQQRLKIHNFGTWLAAWNIPHSILTLPCIHDTTTASVPYHHHKVQPIIPGSCMEGIRHAVQAKQSERSHTRWDVVDEIIATDVLRTFIQLGNTATTPSLVTCYRCPNGDKTWCKYHKDKIFNRNIYDRLKCLTFVFRGELHVNESINNMIWSKCPKRVYVAKAFVICVNGMK